MLSCLKGEHDKVTFVQSAQFLASLPKRTKTFAGLKNVLQALFNNLPTKLLKLVKARMETHGKKDKRSEFVEVIQTVFSDAYCTEMNLEFVANQILLDLECVIPGSPFGDYKHVIAGSGGKEGLDAVKLEEEKKNNQGSTDDEDQVEEEEDDKSSMTKVADKLWVELHRLDSKSLAVCGFERTRIQSQRGRVHGLVNAWTGEPLSKSMIKHACCTKSVHQQ